MGNAQVLPRSRLRCVKRLAVLPNAYIPGQNSSSNCCCGCGSVDQLRFYNLNVAAAAGHSSPIIIFSGVTRMPERLHVMNPSADPLQLTAIRSLYNVAPPLPQPSIHIWNNDGASGFSCLVVEWHTSLNNIASSTSL
jgi:hypothetical protein